MDINKENVYSEESNLKISEEVIATIASTTTKDVTGIHSLAATPAKDVRRFFGKKGEGKGISVDFCDGGVKVEISVIAKFGVKVNEVAKTVQQRVKEAIETMTGINVIEVDVIVAGMKLDTENKSKEKN